MENEYGEKTKTHLKASGKFLPVSQYKERKSENAKKRKIRYDKVSG